MTVVEPLQPKKVELKVAQIVAGAVEAEENDPKGPKSRNLAILQRNPDSDAAAKLADIGVPADFVVDQISFVYALNRSLANSNNMGPRITIFWRIRTNYVACCCMARNCPDSCPDTRRI